MVVGVAVWLDDAEFAARFRTRAVTAERLQSALAGLTRAPLRFGPLRLGPIELAANGAVAAPVLTQRLGEKNPVFDATIPIRLDLSVTTVSRNDYAVDLAVPLTATARYADPLAVVLDIPVVPARAIGIRVRAASAGGRVFGKLTRLDRQLRRRLAQEVNERLAEPSARTVDVGAQIDSA
ncbi:MAG TPA: hypothetical protein VFR17_07230 [Mycobacterium sp.]|nr:hypothetical protein [Mycobacterium sp.]